MDRRPHVGRQVGKDIGDDVAQQLLVAVEVAVERWRGHAHLARYRTQRDGIRALVYQQLAGCLDDLLVVAARTRSRLLGA